MSTLAGRGSKDKDGTLSMVPAESYADSMLQKILRESLLLDFCSENKM